MRVHLLVYLNTLVNELSQTMPGLSTFPLSRLCLGIINIAMKIADFCIATQTFNLSQHCHEFLQMAYSV